ncbi:MAG: hypothetical protein C0598_07290 [Marinilabiliales bacterium]|nr:MAG: hypothetical protein C0598_07290 [Marinilabiliales bacterium]
MRFIYISFIYVYRLAIGIAALFNKKAAQWVNGRRKIFKRIKNSLNSEENIIWFHCASLGEFEQGRPIIENLKKKTSRNNNIPYFFLTFWL